MLDTAFKGDAMAMNTVAGLIPEVVEKYITLKEEGNVDITNKTKSELFELIKDAESDGDLAFLLAEVARRGL
jgi:uncharacterized phage-associated protein